MLRRSESNTAETYAFVFFPLIIVISLILFAATMSISFAVAAFGALLGLSLIWRRRERPELTSLFTLGSAFALFAGLTVIGASEIMLTRSITAGRHLPSVVGLCYAPGLLLLIGAAALYRYDLRQQKGQLKSG